MPSTLRQTLGLSQAALAALLQCGKSQLAMYELGQRTLPAHAELLLGLLQAGAAKATAQPTTPPATLPPNLSPWLTKQLRTWDLQLKNKTQAAEICQQRIQEAEMLVQTLQMAELPPLPPTIDAGELQLQRELLQRKAGYALKKLLQQQMQIQVSVCALQAQLALAGGWL